MCVTMSTLYLGGFPSPATVGEYRKKYKWLPTVRFPLRVYNHSLASLKRYMVSVDSVVVASFEAKNRYREFIGKGSFGFFLPNQVFNIWSALTLTHRFPVNL